jgi:hypothetical protein
MAERIAATLMTIVHLNGEPTPLQYVRYSRRRVIVPTVEE